MKQNRLKRDWQGGFPDFRRVGVYRRWQVMRGMVQTSDGKVRCDDHDTRASNQDASRAKQAAKHGPVFITDRGRPAHVLLTIEDYQKLAGAQATIVDMLAMPGVADIEFDPSHLRGPVAWTADLA